MMAIPLSSSDSGLRAIAISPVILPSSRVTGILCPCISGALIDSADEKSHSRKRSALLILTSNNGCLKTASFRISFINLG